MNRENILLVDRFDTPHSTPPFLKIDIEDYKGAFEASIKSSLDKIDNIVSNEQLATFQNTIQELEFSSLTLDRISSIFFNLNHAETSDKMQELALEIQPMLSDYSSSVSLNERLFERVKYVYDNELESLTPEERRVAEKCYRSFVRNGANLNPEDKEIYRELSSKLGTLSLQFSQNLLSATNAYTLHITSEDDLSGLPDFVVSGAKAEADERGLEGWIITLQAQSMVPFLQYSDKRELREQVWRAYGSRCSTDGESSNTEIVKDIVNLRIKHANLLGYKTHADYVLEERMAKTIERTTQFLDDLLKASLPHGKKDIAMIQKYAESKGFDGKIMGWDFSYYSEKYKSEKLELSDEQLKPYFDLENIQKGLFDICNSLYGLRFELADDIEGYHKDVKCYRVFESDDRLLSILYIDYFPRSTKSGGAWMTSYREHYKYNNEEHIPIISVVCNFTKPTSTTPSLLTFNEVTTLFHEFGHALHGMFAESSYPSIGGTNVAWDFVELPSQIMENWAVDRSFLTKWAKHYKSNEPIPTELIDKIIDVRNYLSGYASVRQLSFGINDMAWHTLADSFEGDIKRFEETATSQTRLFPLVDGVSFTPAFSHIFAGGYSAGYYSYKWAEVLEADAFSRFEREGILNAQVAQEFRDKILSKGDIKDAMELYVDFMGREPKIDALLTKLGLT